MLNWAGQGLLAATGLALIGSTLLSADVQAGEGRHPKPTKTPKPSRRTPTATPTLTATPTQTATPTPTPGTSGPVPFNPANYLGQGDRYGCIDFASQADAQAVLRADPSDPNKLDISGPSDMNTPNGIACDSKWDAPEWAASFYYPAPMDTSPVPRP